MSRRPIVRGFELEFTDTQRVRWLRDEHDQLAEVQRQRSGNDAAATGQGNPVSATVKTASKASCSIDVEYKSGAKSGGRPGSENSLRHWRGVLDLARGLAHDPRRLASHCDLLQGCRLSQRHT
jgi:hypothetical protein